MENLSYALGMVIGHNLKGMGVKDLNVSDFSQALNDVVTGQTCKLTDQEAQQLVNNFIQKQQEEILIESQEKTSIRNQQENLIQNQEDFHQNQEKKEKK